MRHAESLANLKIYSLNSKLSENGIKQSQCLQGHYNLIIVSTLERTLETY